MNKVILTLGIVCSLMFVTCTGVITLTPIGREIMNTWDKSLKKADDHSQYEKLKMVEDNARSMQASYKTDLLFYTQYKGSEHKHEQEWAQQAKMRANKTASNYNEYMLKNSFIWKENIPADIERELPVVP